MLKLVTDESGKRRIVGESEGHLAAADALAKRGRKVATREQIRAIPAVDGSTVRGSERWQHSAHVSNPPIKRIMPDGTVKWYKLKRVTNRSTGKPKQRLQRNETLQQVQARNDIALMARMGTNHYVD